MPFRAHKRRRCVYCGVRPSGFNAEGLCVQCRDRFKCAVCRHVVYGERPRDWCADCTEHYLAWRHILLGFRGQRPDASTLAARLDVYRARAALALPLFVPVVIDPEEVSTAPARSASGASSERLNGQAAAHPSTCKCLDHSACYPTIKVRRLAF